MAKLVNLGVQLAVADEDSWVAVAIMDEILETTGLLVDLDLASTTSFCPAIETCSTQDCWP